MKKIINVISLLILSVFVSGYTFNVEMTINEDRSVEFKKELIITDEEIKSKCVSNTCTQGDPEYTEIKNKLSFNDSNYQNIDTYNISTENDKTIVTINYKDLDDCVGPAYDKLGIFKSNYKYELLKMSGSKYVSNLSNNVIDGLTEGTFKLKVPYELENINGKKVDDKTYTWDLTKDKNIKFEFKTEIESTGKEEYNKIKMNQTIMIGGGIVVALIVIILFINIIRKSTKEDIKKEIENSSVDKFEQNDIFNANANLVKPVESIENPINVMTEDEIKNHEDKISNKFLDDSFADPNAVSDEEKLPIVTEKKEEPIAVESTTIEEDDIPEFEDSSSNELVDNSNMSSVAFGGAPIEDKNINEIK